MEMHIFWMKRCRVGFFLWNQELFFVVAEWLQSIVLLYRTLGYTGIRAHTGPREFQSPAQKQLTVRFVQSSVFGYIGFLVNRTLNLSRNQPVRYKINWLDRVLFLKNWLGIFGISRLIIFLRFSFLKILLMEKFWAASQHSFSLPPITQDELCWHFKILSLQVLRCLLLLFWLFLNS